MNQVKQTKNPFPDLLPYLVLFILMFLYFGFFADYAAYYQEQTSLFVFSHEYLAEHFHQPGSPLIYLSNFITTFFHIPFTGAVLVSVIIFLVVFFISKIINFLAGRKQVLIPFLFGATLFYFHTNYQYLLYNSAGLLLQLVFFYLTIRYLKGWLPVIIIPFWYFLTGAFAWIFLLMFTLHIVTRTLRKDWLKLIVLWLIMSVIIFVLKEYFLFQSAGTLLTYPFSDNGAGFQLKILALYVILIAILPLIARIKIKLFRTIKIPGILKKPGPSFIILLVLLSISILRFDKKTRQYFSVEKLFCQGRYNEVVDYTKRNPPNNILTIYLNNIALCETGRLNDQLFNLRQDPEGQTLFLKWEMSGEILRRGGYFYYAVGVINEAQRWAYENMIMNGLTPEDLKMLIRTEIINGNYEIASKYISIQKKTLFYREEAKRYEKLLFNDQAVDSDPVLGLKRKEKINHDYFSITDDPYINVERILSYDSLNRKAFEYKLAFMLLKKDYLGIAAQLEGLGKYGFKRMPIHIEEAAEAYKTLNLGPMAGQGTLAPNPQTAQRFNQFLQTFQQYGNNLKSAEPALRQKFGNTFWYYAFYR
ncbi:MAG: DUF6057 family protein [Bacteroidales bacterium]